LDETNRYLDETDIGRAITPEMRERIQILTNGHPILIALAIEWLGREMPMPQLVEKSPAELLALDEQTRAQLQEEFQEALVRKILELEPLDRAILNVAQARYRFDVELLSSLMELSRHQSEEMIESLSRLPFVKTKPEGLYVLHDEMQRMVTEYVWSYLDPLGTERRSISKEIVDYYDWKLQTEEDEMRKQALTAEKAYHVLYANLEKKYSILGHSIRGACGAYQFGYMEALIGKGREYNETRIVSDKVLDRIIGSSTAWLLFERWDTDTAEQLFRELWEEPGLEVRIKASVALGLGGCAGRRGDYERARELYDEAVGIYDTLESGEIPLEDGFEVRPSEIKEERSALLHDIGWTFRRQGNWGKAREYYERSLEEALEIGDRSKIAMCYNDIGFVCRYLGRIDEAFDRCEAGLMIRRKFGSKRAIALSYNTIGLVHRDNDDIADATRYFEMARELFKEVDDKAGLARVWRNLASISLNEGRWEEAKERSEESLQICEEFDIKREMANTLNKLGRAHLALENWEEAEKCFLESLRYARGQADLIICSDALVQLCILGIRKGLMYDDIAQYVSEIKQMEQIGASFRLHLGELEFALGDLEYRDGNYKDAFAHYGKAYVYWVKHNRRRYEKELGILREKLRYVPIEQVPACADQLIITWKENKLDKSYPGFIELADRFKAQAASIQNILR
jgi:tetratricopeptide (TPR) repeat protein